MTKEQLLGLLEYYKLKYRISYDELCSILDGISDVGESERFDYVCKEFRRLRREIFKVELKINGLSLDDCRRLQKLFSEGKNYHEIAEMFNIRIALVIEIMNQGIVI